MKRYIINLKKYLNILLSTSYPLYIVNLYRAFYNPHKIVTILILKCNILLHQSTSMHECYKMISCCIMNNPFTVHSQTTLLQTFINHTQILFLSNNVTRKHPAKISFRFAMCANKRTEFRIN